MITDTLAVYESGKLRPLQSLPLKEGETVRLQVTRETTERPSVRDAAFQQSHGTSKLDELFAAFESADENDENYDLLEALDANRQGERPLYPPELKGVTW